MRYWGLLKARLITTAAVAIVFAALAPIAHAQGEAQGSLSEIGCWEQTTESGTPDCPADTQEDGLNGPADVAVSPDGQNVYVLSYEDEAIDEFTRNGDGSLTPVSGNSCIAEASDEDSTCDNQVAIGIAHPEAMAISPDGNNLYVVGTDNTDSGIGTIAEFARNPSDGSLTQLSPNACIAENTGETDGERSECPNQSGHGLEDPVGLAVSPDGNDVYVADEGESEGEGSIAVFARNSNGSLSQLNGAEDCITEQGDDNSDCSSTAVGLTYADSVVVSPNNDNVYTGSDDNDGAIAEFARNGDGSLSQLGGDNACIGESEDCGDNSAVGVDDTVALAISPDGSNLYSSSEDEGDSDVAEFAINPDGSLSQLGGNNNCIEETGADVGCNTTGTGLSEAYELKLSPDGADLYVATQEDDCDCLADVAELSRNLDGSLTQLASPDNCIEENGSDGDCPTNEAGEFGDGEVAVSPDGNNVYATGSNGVAELSRAPIQYSLSVSLTGSGSGSVTDNTEAIHCPGTCSADYNEGTQVSLTATPSNGSTFVGWSGGGCSGTGGCNVTMNSDTQVSAEFEPVYTLNVTLSGAGSGSVSDGGALNCPGTCSNTYTAGTPVTLTATPSNGSTFVGWSGGGCSGTSTCQVTMNSDTDVTADFAPPTPPDTLKVSLAGDGSGSVADRSGAISCPSTCSHAYPSGTQVNLTATPSSGSIFIGWTGGGCSGNGGCQITMSADTNVTATFGVPPANSTPPTPGSPSLVAGTPAVHGDNGAAFAGSVNPEGSPTYVFFAYGLDKRYTQPGSSGPTYTNATPSHQLGSDQSNHQASASVSGLAPNSLYHVRIVAYNQDGITYGPDQTFTTGAGPAPPAPKLGKTFNAEPVSGIVYLLEHGKLIPITENTQIPVGSILDTLHGSLMLHTSTGKNGKTYEGTFGGAVFKFNQMASGPSKGLSTLTLWEGTPGGVPAYASCKAKGAADAHAALSSRVLQTLRSHVSGSFRTRGRYAAGTVRGTQWTTTDRCDGTLISVQVHSVLVINLYTSKTFLISAGHHYLARAPLP